MALISISEIMATKGGDSLGVGNVPGGTPPAPEHVNLDPPKAVARPNTYAEYVQRLQSACVAAGVPMDYVGTVWSGPYHRTSYALYRLMLRRPSGNQPPVCFVSGLHGDEPGGPLGVLDFVENHYPGNSRGALCPVYPLVNPWGFDHQKRVNGVGQDVNRTFGEADEKSDESRILLADMGNFPFSFLHTLHEDGTRTGFYAYYTDSSKLWLAERLVECASGHSLPINSTAVDYGGKVRLNRGLAPYNYTLYPPPVTGVTLEDYWLGKGVQHFVTETPSQADRWVRAKCNAALMKLVWTFA